ncbi:MAG: hypothetical protein KBG29_13920 [Pseudomonadales bacterium]|nr:hypothetical protein [Pseudomonadales bacterium]
MKHLVHAALVCAAMVATASAQPVAPEIVEGVALRLPERSEVYRERHEIGALSHRIEYRAPDGTLIAEKTLDYRCSQSAPAFEQHDLRSGSRIGARWHDGAYLLLRDDETRALETGASLVASSGFDRFVRANWETLAAGRSIDLDFALPARLQSLRLRIARIAAPEEIPGVALWLRIVPAQPLLRAFVDPIELAYDDGRHLALYRGLSNLAGADGKGLAVEIRYRRVPPDSLGEEREIATTAAVATEPASAAARTPAHLHCAEERS